MSGLPVHAFPERPWARPLPWASTRRVFRGPLLVFGAFLLTLLPVILLQVRDARVRASKVGRQARLWQKRALATIDDFRQTYTYSIQLERQMTRLLARLETAFRRAGPLEPGRAAAQLAVEIGRRIPPSHRPKESRLYVFAEQSHGKWSPLPGRGLTTLNGRMLGEVVGGLLADGPSDNIDLGRLNRRCLSLFGDFISLDLLGRYGRGRVIPVRMQGRNWLLYWQTVKVPGSRPLGAILLVPGRVEKTSRPLLFALRRVATGRRKEFLPLLIPLQSARGLRPVVISRSLTPTRVKQLELQFLAGGERDVVIPSGRVSTEFPGFWILRDAVSKDLPYELWLLTRVSPDLGRVQMASAEFLLILLLASGWGIWAVRSLVLGMPVDVSLQTWFLGFFALAGALPLTALYLLASFLIESRLEREKEDTVQQAARELEETDAGVARVKARFEVLCRQVVRHPATVDEIRRHPCGVLTPPLQECFREFERRGFPPRFLLTFRYGRDNSGLPAPGHRKNIHQGFQDFFLPMFIGVADQEGPGRKDEVMASLSARDRNVVTAISYTMPKSLYSDLFSLRDQAQLFVEHEDASFWYYDFLASSARFEMVVTIQADAVPSFARYLRWQMGRLSERHPERQYLLGRLVPGGVTRLVRRGPSAEAALGLPRLWSAMTDGARGQEPRSLLTGRRAHLIHPCRHTSGFVLGSAISFAPILERAERFRWWVDAGALAIGLAMVTLAIGLGGHLLLPLKRMEEGLTRIAAGDLEVVVGSSREDELGEVTASFAGMIDGLRERRDLGRFVSGTMEFGVDEARETEAALLVSDLRSFTTLSEAHPPEAIVRMLNLHHETMSQEIQAAGGRVDRFIGDAIVSAFFAPTLAEASLNAVRGAAGMRRAHLRLQAERTARGDFPYEMGVGLAAGKVLLGSFGSDRRRERAVIGEPLDEAEMLEVFSKTGKTTRIIASPDLVRLISQVRFLPLAGTDAWELADLKEGAG